MKKRLLIEILSQLGYIIRNMATEAQLNAKITEVEEALTAEIEQIKQIPDVPDAAVERLDALKTRISGIVAETPPEP